MTRTAPVSHHLLIEVHGCDPVALNAPQVWSASLLSDGEATVLPRGGFHAFEPLGLSGALVIGDVVLTVHTWPEHGFATVDLFARRPLDAEAWASRVAKALHGHSRSLGKT